MAPAICSRKKAVSRFDELRARMWELEQELEAEAERLRAEFAQRRADGGGRLRTRQAAQRQRLLPYLFRARPAHVLTAPVIYGLIVPLALLDLALTVYQQVCFRAWGIERVRRRDFFAFDRHRLSYLNIIEKLNCDYCAYANGLVAYAREVAGRTEQYWCPVRHAARVRAPHRHYRQFVPYGDGEAYRRELPILRRRLRGGRPPRDPGADVPD
jgi:hypothetical protein